MRTVIQYEDEHILVVYKPAGFATQTAGVGQADVVSELKNYLKGGYVGVVHRLDQPVEGLLVFARTREAAASLTALLQKGLLYKRYLAVVCGKPECDRGELADYLIKTADNRTKIVEGFSQKAEGKGGKAADAAREDVLGAKPARLRFELLAQSDGGEMSLLGVSIDTGRFHQIRAQLAHAGMPIIGDVKYGSEYSRELGRIYNVRNVALCACELRCRHPVTGESLHFIVEPQGEIFRQFRRAVSNL